MSDDREPMGDSPTESDQQDQTPAAPEKQDGQIGSSNVPDPADIVPVPPAMSAAEIDERAQVVEKLRQERDDAMREP